MYGAQVSIYWYIILFLTIISSCCSCHGAGDSTIKIVVDWSDNRYNNLSVLQEKISSRFLVEKLTYTADILLEQDEFIGLLGFDQGVEVDCDVIQEGLARLGQKKKFKSVEVVLSSVRGGYELHFTLEAFWTFKRVQCQGSLVGRDRYKHYYLLEPGERFDHAKHTDSLRRIKESFHEQGYLNPDVTDTIIQDEQTKTVAVIVHLHQGECFFIHGIDICCDDAEQHNAEECRRILSALKKMLFRELRGESYSKGALEYILNQAQEYCFRRGFLQASLAYDHRLQLDYSRVDLTFRITLGDKRDFEFFGNHFFSKQELLDYVMKFGKAALFLPPSLIVEDLIALYKSYGFWNVAITFQEESERCFFCITEGVRSRIVAVTTRGADFFSPQFFNRCYAPLIRRKAFDQKVLFKARNKIMQSYVSAGFWDCEIGQESYNKLEDGLYELVVEINEGKQRLLRSVVVEEFGELMLEPLFVEYSALSEPIPFDIHLIQEQRRYLLNYLQCKGCLYANPRPQLEQHKDGIDLIWKIEGSTERACFGKTIIAGSSHLPSLVVARELAYKEGDMWDQDKLDRSLERLKALKIFERINLYSDIFDESNKVKNVIVQFLEDDPFELRVRGGVQFIGRNLRLRDMSFRTGGSFFWKNPRNDGDCFTFDADVTGHTRDIVGCYQVPWLCGQPITTSFKGYSVSFDQPLASCSKERLYRLSQNGFAINCAHALGQVQSGLNLGVEWMEIDKISLKRARVVDFASRLVDKKVPYIFMEPTVLVSCLNDPVNPRLGFVSLISGKAMVPLDNMGDYFVKIFAEQSFFVPVARGIVLAVRLRGGHIFNQCFSQIMPSERFYLGGAYSLRAYEADLAPPLNSFTDFGGFVCLVPIGGKSMINATAEVRCSFYKNWGGVFFTDCGALVQDDVSNIHSGNMLGATGFGIRYYTPVGPIRFDIGWKWKKDPAERRAYAWFLTLGHVF